MKPIYLYSCLMPDKKKRDLLTASIINTATTPFHYILQPLNVFHDLRTVDSRYQKIHFQSGYALITPYETYLALSTPLISSISSKISSLLLRVRFKIEITAPLNSCFFSKICTSPIFIPSSLIPS